MSAAIPRVRKQVGEDVLLAHLLSSGVVVVERALAGELQARLAEECAGLLANRPAAGYGDLTRRVSGLANKLSSFAEIVLNPIAIKACTAVLRPNCSAVQLNLSQIIEVCPGQVCQELHRDDYVWPLNRPRAELLVGVMWAMTDFTRENGGTRVIPGSHNWSDERAANCGENDVVTAEMPAGSALIWLGSVVHGAGANRTAAGRIGIYLGYCLGWLRQEENQYLVAPASVANRYSAEVRELLGYTLHRPYLGWVGEVESPSVLFEPERK